MEITRVGIIGSGIMGSGIAEVAAASGYEVTLRSRAQESADAMKTGVEKSLNRQVEKEKRTAGEAEEILARISTTTKLGDLADCDLIIESIVEDLDTKLALLAELNGIVSASTIVASNTSTLPVAKLAAAMSHPENVCGIHFFNPAPAMPLVEVIRPLTVSDETFNAAMAFATSCGKDAVEVQDHAGFIVNALLFPYLNNAIRMMENGTATKEGIDTAMKGGCGFPMGPFALLDLVGLDTSLAILDTLFASFGDANYEAMPLLRQMVAEGKLGRKTKIGFYDYAK
jgi:3-hydroxybutyryl-CoA dehydrogenase